MRSMVEGRIVERRRAASAPSTAFGGPPPPLRAPLRGGGTGARRRIEFCYSLVNRSDMMLSESARMTTAKEAAFRIDYPNSRPRAVKVVALDEASVGMVRQLAEQEWKNTTFFTSIVGDWDPGRPWGTPIHAGLIDLDGNRRDLVEEIGAANLAVTLSTAGRSAEPASLIAEACSLKRVMITGLLLTSERSTDDEVASTLRTLRPHAPMLVVSSEPEYVTAMLTALRA